MTQQTANLTALASYNEMVRAVERAIAGQLDTAAALAAMAPFEKEFLSITGIFHAELRFQLDSPALQEHMPKVLEAFNRIQFFLLELKDALHSEDMELASRLLRRLSKRVTQMMNAFEALKADEESRELLSPSPFINELLRVAYAYLEGKLSADLLNERLQGVMGHLHTMLANLEQTEPDPKEAALMADRRTEMDEALDEQLAALHEIEEHLRSGHGDPQELTLPLETLRETTQSLYELTQSLAQAMLAEEQKHCFRCGTGNDRSARFCSKCNAVFPTFNEEPSPDSQVNVRLEEEIVSAAPRELPPLVRQLLEKVEEVAKGSKDVDGLRREYEAAESRMHSVQKMLDSLEEPSEDTPDDQLKVYEDSLTAMREGLAHFAEGLQGVADYLQRQDSRQLWDALHKLVPAAEQLSSLQSRGTSWIQQAQRPS